MHRHLLALTMGLVFAGASASSSHAQTSSIQRSVSSQAELTNNDILEMAKAKLSSEIIAAKIENSPCDFNTSPTALIELKAAGVPEAVILAMVRSPRKMSPEEEAACPCPGGVYSVGGNVVAPVAIYDPDPPYGEQARKHKIQGTVVLSIVVDAHGNVHDVQVVKGIKDAPDLDVSAINTVYKWKFKPAIREGKPVAARTLAGVGFRLF